MGGRGTWVRDRATGEVGRVVEVDHMRGFGGCVRLAAPAGGEWRPVGARQRLRGLDPWVPRVGERVRVQWGQAGGDGGTGVVRRHDHPTRDGAIAAWRAAVKGGAR